MSPLEKLRQALEKSPQALLECLARAARTEGDKEWREWICAGEALAAAQDFLPDVKGRRNAALQSAISNWQGLGPEPEPAGLGTLSEEIAQLRARVDAGSDAAASRNALERRRDDCLQELSRHLKDLERVQADIQSLTPQST